MRLVSFHSLYSWLFGSFQKLLIFSCGSISHSRIVCMLSLRFGSCCQESSQNLAVRPSFTSQKLCFWIRSLFWIAEFHISDPLLVSDIRILSSKGKFLEYLAVQSLAQGVLKFESHRHHIFAPMVLLLCSGSLSPMPPAIRGRQTFSHRRRAHFLFGPELPHRKFLYRFLMALRTHLGAAKMEKR